MQEKIDATAALISSAPDLHLASSALRRVAGYGPDDMAALLQVAIMAHGA